jgi:hypothetical protein
MSASFLSVAHPSSRLTIGAIAFALLSVGITAPVSGRDYCNTTTPALDEVVTCVGQAQPTSRCRLEQTLSVSLSRVPVEALATETVALVALAPKFKRSFLSPR